MDPTFSTIFLLFLLEESCVGGSSSNNGVSVTKFREECFVGVIGVVLSGSSSAVTDNDCCKNSII